MNRFAICTEITPAKQCQCTTRHITCTDITHLLIKPIAQLRDPALNLVELAALLLPVSLYNVHHGWIEEVGGSPSLDRKCNCDL